MAQVAQLSDSFICDIWKGYVGGVLRPRSACGFSRAGCGWRRVPRTEMRCASGSFVVRVCVPFVPFGVRGGCGAFDEPESLILAQSERWRHA